MDVHSTSEVLCRLCANTDPQRDSIFTKGPAEVLLSERSVKRLPERIQEVTPPVSTNNCARKNPAGAAAQGIACRRGSKRANIAIAMARDTMPMPHASRASSRDSAHRGRSTIQRCPGGSFLV